MPGNAAMGGLVQRRTMQQDPEAAVPRTSLSGAALWLWLRALHRSGGMPALRRAAPLACGLILAAGIIFQPYGLTAAQVLAFGRAYPLCGRLLLIAYLTLATKVARAILLAPETRLLRVAPLPLWAFALCQGAWLALAEAPLAILALRTGEVLLAAALSVGAMATHALLCAAPRRGFVLAAGPLLLGAAWPGTPLWVALALSSAALWLALPAALRRAVIGDEGEPAGLALLLPRLPATLALALCHGAALWRGEGSALLRAALLSAAGAGVAIIAARSNEVASGAPLARMALGVAALPLSLAASGLAGPVLRAEGQLRWLLRAAGARGATQALGVALALGVPVALCGALYGGLIGAAQGGASRLVLCGAAFGGGIAVLQGGGARRALRGDDGDGERAFLWAFGIALVLAIGAWALGELLLVPLVPCGVLALAAGTGDLALEGRRRYGQAARDGVLS